MPISRFLDLPELKNPDPKIEKIPLRKSWPIYAAKAYSEIGKARKKLKNSRNTIFVTVFFCLFEDTNMWLTVHVLTLQESSDFLYRAEKVRLKIDSITKMGLMSDSDTLFLINYFIIYYWWNKIK